VITDVAMAALVATGEAVALLSIPGGPVEYDGHWWVTAGHGWHQVTDPAVIAELDRDKRRLAALDQATRRSRLEGSGDSGTDGEPPDGAA
jgi:hypothetical protein